MATLTTESVTVRHNQGERVPFHRQGSGESLLYLHGMTGLGGEARVIELLAEQFDVIAPYHPGWGTAEGLEEHDGALDLIFHYVDFLDAMGISGPVRVAGHSIGAWLAAELADAMPERVSALVLAMPVGIWDDDIQGEDPFAQPPMSATEVLLADPARRSLLWSNGNGAVDPGEAYLAEMRSLKASAKYLWPIPDTGIARRLGRIRARTLVIVGDQDRFVPPDYGELWRQRIPDCRLTTLRGAGHLGTVDQPEAFASAVAAFLAREP